MNYKTNNTLTIGIFADTPGQTTQTPILVLNHSASWNKVYINLTADVESVSTPLDFKIFIGMNREAGVTSPAAFIDNLKLVTF